MIGGATLYGGSNYAFTYDRFCNPNQAVYFNNGYLQVPPGVYFSGDFTFIAWVNWKTFLAWERIIDFGIGINDNVLVAMDQGYGTILSVGLYEGPNYNNLNAGSSFQYLDQWYHVAVVLRGTQVYWYYNGSLIGTSITYYTPNNLIRTSNYIGKSNWPTIPNANAIYDEIKIYQGAMTQTQILQDYTNSSNNGKCFFFI